MSAFLNSQEKTEVAQTYKFTKVFKAKMIGLTITRIWRKKREAYTSEYS